MKFGLASYQIVTNDVTPRLWSFGNPVQAIVNYYKGRMTREDDGSGGEKVNGENKGGKGLWKEGPFFWGGGRKRFF